MEAQVSVWVEADTGVSLAHGALSEFNSLELWVHCLAREARNWSGGDELYVQKFRHLFLFIWNGNSFAFRWYKDKYVE